MFSFQIPSLYLFVWGDFYYLTDFLLFVAHCLIPDNKCFLTFVVFDCNLSFKASCSSLYLKIQLLFFLYFCSSFSFSISPLPPPFLSPLTYRIYSLHFPFSTSWLVGFSVVFHAEIFFQSLAVLVFQFVSNF